MHPFQSEAQKIEFQNFLFLEKSKKFLEYSFIGNMNFNNPSVYFVLVLILALRCATAKAEAFFVFGDSLVDIGNNNFLVTTARADMPPYGIDYPTHSATGRFSNGLNIADLISKVPILFILCKIFSSFR